jgi:holin-like protein
MLRGLAVVLLFQLAGEVLAHLAELPVPGPVVGMVLLMMALEVRKPLQEVLRSASGGLLAHLSLLFVPAGVGVVQHGPRLLAEWPALLATVLLSTWTTVGVTGWLAQRLSRSRAAAPPGSPSPSPSAETPR